MHQHVESARELQRKIKIQEIAFTQIKKICELFTLLVYDLDLVVEVPGLPNNHVGYKI